MRRMSAGHNKRDEQLHEYLLSLQRAELTTEGIRGAEKILSHMTVKNDDCCAYVSRIYLIITEQTRTKKILIQLKCIGTLA